LWGGHNQEFPNTQPTTTVAHTVASTPNPKKKKQIGGATTLNPLVWAASRHKEGGTTGLVLTKKEEILLGEVDGE